MSMGDQGTKCHRNIMANCNRVSSVYERYRQTRDGWVAAYSEREREFMVANISQTRIWADAQRDGCPVEYRWCPLFSAAKFGRRPQLECRAVMLPRRETR